MGAGHSTQSVLFVHNVQMACVPLKWLKISVGTMSRDVLRGLYRCWHQPCSLLPDAEQQTQHLCRGRAGPGPCPSGRITRGSSERQISLMPLHFPHLLGVSSSGAWIFALPSVPQNWYQPLAVTSSFFPIISYCHSDFSSRRVRYKQGKGISKKHITQIKSEPSRHSEEWERTKHHYQQWSEQNPDVQSWPIYH